MTDTIGMYVHEVLSRRMQLASASETLESVARVSPRRKGFSYLHFRTDISMSET